MRLTYYFGRNSEEFEYEVDYDKVREKAINYYAQLYGATTGGARSVIAGLMADDLLLYEEDEDFIEYLTEEFEDEASEQYNEECEYRRDPYAYYGVSRSDFF